MIQLNFLNKLQKNLMGYWIKVLSHITFQNISIVSISFIGELLRSCYDCLFILLFFLLIHYIRQNSICHSLAKDFNAFYIYNASYTHKDFIIKTNLHGTSFCVTMHQSIYMWYILSSRLFVLLSYYIYCDIYRFKVQMKPLISAPGLTLFLIIGHLCLYTHICDILL